jgi:hypothetical protein
MLVVRHAQPYPNFEIGESIECICRHVSIFPGENRVGTFNPDPLGLRFGLILLRLGLISWRFGSIGCTATLALAGVLAFAPVVTRFAPALTFAGILALTSVLFGFVFVLVRTAVITHAHSLDPGVALVLA